MMGKEQFLAIGVVLVAREGFSEQVSDDAKDEKERTLKGPRGRAPQAGGAVRAGTDPKD